MKKNETKAHTICQCCGQSIIAPNIGIIKFLEKDRNSALRALSLAEVHGFTVGIEKIKKGNSGIIPLSKNISDIKKIDVLNFVIYRLIILEKQAILYR